MLGKEEVPMDALNISQQVESKFLITEAERKQKISQEKKSERLLRLAALDIQVGLGTCFSYEDRRASKWICSQSVGIPQG